MKIKHHVLKVRFLLFGVCFGLMSFISFANSQHRDQQSTDNAAWFTQDPLHWQAVQLRVDLFLSTTCPHCRAATEFFHQLETQIPWISIHRYYVNKDKIALDRLNDLVRAEKIKINPFAVPAVFFCHARWLGFDNTKNSGNEILKGLTYCHEQIIATGQLTPMTVNAIQKSGVSAWYESNIVSNSSWSALLPTLAALDALMPCSLFSFLVMFAFLFLIPSKCLRLVLGGLFLSSLGLIHYLQQVHTAFFYEILREFRGLMVGVGFLLLGLLVFFYSKKRNFLPLNGHLKTMGLGFVAVLTVSGVYSYHQGCIPNYSLVFQDYLVRQSLPLQQQFFSILLYQIIYLSMLALLLVIALVGSARLVNYQQLLQKIVWFILLFSAGFLILRIFISF